MDQFSQKIKEHCKIAIIGNVDSGKSTLVGVLTKGIQDDGRGSAREKVFNYKHEKENGRTSSIAQEIMGFDLTSKQILPDRYNPNKNKYWKEVVEKSSKIVTFLDLCGHEKYLKTTIFGLVAMVPDYSMIIVGANMGVQKMTREHLGLSLFLNVPFIIILSKVDIAPTNVHEETIEFLKKIIKSQLINRTPVLINETTSLDEIEKYAQVIHGNKLVPIFQVSSVTGQGLEGLRQFISKVQNRDKLIKAYDINAPFQYDIQEHFQVNGVGIVVSGLVRSGIAHVGQHAFLGPDKNKQFKQVIIKSIHINRVAFEEASIGELACFAIKPSKAQEKLERCDFRKGMVLIDPSIKTEPVREFIAKVHVLHHPTTMSPGYQAVMHCGVIRQAVQILNLTNKEVLRSEDEDVVRFKFVYNSEYLKEDQIIVIREGRTKIFGTILKAIPDAQLILENPQQKQEVKKHEGQQKTDGLNKQEGQNKHEESHKQEGQQKQEGQTKVHQNKREFYHQKDNGNNAQQKESLQNQITEKQVKQKDGQELVKGSEKNKEATLQPTIK